MPFPFLRAVCLWKSIFKLIAKVAVEAHHLTADIFIALLIRSPPQASTANAARLKARRADGTIAAVVHPYDGQIRRDPMNINGRPECAAVLTAETIQGVVEGEAETRISSLWTVQKVAMERVGMGGRTSRNFSHRI